MLAIFVALSCVFLPEHFSLLRLSLFYSEFFTDILSVILSSRFSVRCFLRINLFYLFSAQLLRSLGGSFMKIELLFQYGYGIMIYKEKRFVFHNKSRFEEVIYGLYD